MSGEQSKFLVTISLYGACSEDILVQRSCRYYSESAYHRMRVHGRIRFEYAKVYMWNGKFLNLERKRWGFKNIRIRVDGALKELLSAYRRPTINYMARDKVMQFKFVCENKRIY